MRAKIDYQLLVTVGSLALLASGCTDTLPESYPLSTYNNQQLLGAKDDKSAPTISNEDMEKIEGYLKQNFGTPNDPRMKSKYMSEDLRTSVGLGAQLYKLHCIHCHGLAGDGAGPTAAFLFPRPRDYRRGTFKWKSTERNDKPTREDLTWIVKEGAIGSSMPAFRLLPEAEVNQLVDYVIFLSSRGEFERKLLIAAASGDGVPDAAGADELIASINESWANAASKVIVPAKGKPTYAEGTPEFEESLQRGKKLYLAEKAACYKCHNNDGRANPDLMAEAERKQNVDDWGNKNYPRNLRLAMYRGGRRPLDIYRRVHQGIAGAAMPAGEKNLSPEEIWDIVNFVKAAPYRKDLWPEVKKPVDSHGHDHSESAGH